MSVATLAAGPARASANGPSVTGSGHYEVAGQIREFTFHAVTHEDGTVTGEAQLNAGGIDFSEHLRIDCLQVMGTTAYLSGAITNSSNDSFVGGTGTFAVRDNGEGAGSADQISALHSDPASLPGQCEAEHRSTDHVVEEGNVQVH